MPSVVTMILPSHAFIQPHASKISGQIDATEDAIAAKVVEHNEDGLIITGAFMMATQGATCDEIFVYPSPHLPHLTTRIHSPLRLPYLMICQASPSYAGIPMHLNHALIFRSAPDTKKWITSSFLIMC